MKALRGGLYVEELVQSMELKWEVVDGVRQNRRRGFAPVT